MLLDRETRSAFRSEAVKVGHLRSRSQPDPLAERIARCGGYTVERAGAWIGTIEQVAYAPSARWDHPHGVTVRLGRASRRLVRVAVVDVLDVRPAERRVVLAPNFDFSSHLG